MTSNQKPRIIVVTGAESTGKSILTAELAKAFSAPFFPEYARGYLEEKGLPYTREDVIHIARQQIIQMEKAIASGNEWFFFDTWLIVTKVWLEVVYGEVPDFIMQALKTFPVSLYLLCQTDIPWEPDPLRENGGEMREELSEIYRENLIRLGSSYRMVTGMGRERLENATRIIRERFLVNTP